MDHTAAHGGKHPHGFIQLHLVNKADAPKAEADIRNNLMPFIPDIQNVDTFEDSIFVYVAWDQPQHVPQNDNTPAHERIQALRTIIQVRDKRPGTPFYNSGLSHNWCCYGDQ